MDLQNESFCLPKGLLLPCERTPFAVQNEPFCTTLKINGLYEENFAELLMGLKE